MLRHLIATLLFAMLALLLTVFAFSWANTEERSLSPDVESAEPEAIAEAVREETRAAYGEWLFYAVLTACFAGGALAVVLSRSVLAPIERITDTARQMAGGDLSVRASVRSDNELAKLAEALNAVAKQMEGTLREQRRESIRLRTLLNGMQDAVCLTDGGGMIVLSNRAFDELFAREGTGRPVVDVITNEQIRACVWSALRGTDTTDTVELAVGTSVRSLLVQVTPLSEEGGAVMMIHDVTPLRRADRIRRDFVANASHELRTPLTAIRGFAETLRDGALDDRERAHRFVDVILRNAMRLQVVADDLVRLSKAEARTQDFGLSAVSIREIVDDVGSTFDEQAKQKGVRFGVSVEDQPIAHSNAVALDHMLGNLIHNAIKACSPGGEVRVAARKEGSLVAIEISDDGPGIAEEHLDRIFERFYRVDRGRSADGGGTGLGLAIVKHLAERIDAELDVQSELGRGSTFVIKIPQAN